MIEPGAKQNNEEFSENQGFSYKPYKGRHPFNKNDFQSISTESEVHFQEKNIENII